MVLTHRANRLAAEAVVKIRVLTISLNRLVLNRHVSPIIRVIIKVEVIRVLRTAIIIERRRPVAAISASIFGLAIPSVPGSWKEDGVSLLLILYVVTDRI